MSEATVRPGKRPRPRARIRAAKLQSLASSPLLAPQSFANLAFLHLEAQPSCLKDAFSNQYAISTPKATGRGKKLLRRTRIPHSRSSPQTACFSPDRWPRFASFFGRQPGIKPIFARSSTLTARSSLLPFIFRLLTSPTSPPSSPAPRLQPSPSRHDPAQTSRATNSSRFPNTYPPTLLSRTGSKWFHPDTRPTVHS